MAKVISMDGQRKKNSSKVDLKKQVENSSKDYSPQIIKIVEDFFKSQEWKHKPVDEHGVIAQALKSTANFAQWK